jgi:hypothetical protein
VEEACVSQWKKLVFSDGSSAFGGSSGLSKICSNVFKFGKGPGTRPLPEEGAMQGSNLTQCCSSPPALRKKKEGSFTP